MNERIVELIEECTDRHFSECSGGFETFDKEKFAELIVRECTKILDEDSHIMPELGVYAHDICKHFGIKYQ